MIFPPLRSAEERGTEASGRKPVHHVAGQGAPSQPSEPSADHDLERPRPKKRQAASTDDAPAKAKGRDDNNGDGYHCENPATIPVVEEGVVAGASSESSGEISELKRLRRAQDVVDAPTPTPAAAVVPERQEDQDVPEGA